MPTLTIIHGLPGSGKSTLAMEILKKNPNTVRINRDDIRTALFGEEYHSGKFPNKCERQAQNVETQLIREALRKKQNVVVDNTNLSVRALQPLVDFARAYKYDLKQIPVDVPVEECKRRNHKRAMEGGREVPESAIDRMASRAYDDNGHIKDFIIGKNGIFIVPKETEGMKIIEKYNRSLQKENPIKDKSVVLLDFDGTLVNNAEMSDKFFGNKDKKLDFGGYYQASNDAPFNKSVQTLVRDLRADNLNIFLLTARPDNYAKLTIEKLQQASIPVSRLIMKRDGDFRSDLEFKKEAFQKLQEEQYAVVHAIEDRKKIISLWNQLGVLTSNVDEHIPHPFKEENSYSEPRLNTFFGSGYCIRCGKPLKNGGNIGDICRKKISL